MADTDLDLNLLLRRCQLRTLIVATTALYTVKQLLVAL